MPSIESTTASAIVVPSRASSLNDCDTVHDCAEALCSFRVTEAASLRELIERLLPRPVEVGPPLESVGEAPASLLAPAEEAHTGAPADPSPAIAAAPTPALTPAAAAANDDAGPAPAPPAVAMPPVSTSGSARLVALIAEQRRLVERMAEVSRSLHLNDLPPAGPVAVAEADVAPTRTAATEPPPLPITEPTFVNEPDPAATGLVRAIAAAGRFVTPRGASPTAETTAVVLPPPASTPDAAMVDAAATQPVRIPIPETMAVARSELAPSPLPAFLAGVAASVAAGAVLYAALTLV